MDWAWTSSLDQIWRSASFPMWVTLAAAGFFAILMLITLLRAEKSVANGALTVITLLAVGVAVAATIRSFGLPGSPTSATGQAPPPAMAAAPALACIDDLAGETVLTACEKTLFGSAETTAAAISYAASQITRLTSLGDAATVTRNLTPEVESLRRSIERDRYGLMAYVLVARDHCSPQACPAFRALGNSRQIMTNMDDRVYEGLVMRYSASWGAPAAPPSIAAMPPGVVAALPGVPTGKPTTMIDFPSASSTPPVSIMTPEPGAPGSAAPPRAATPARPAAAAAAPNAPAAPAAPPPAAKKQAPKAARAPTQLAPPPGSQAPSSPPPAPASAADND